MPSYKHVSHSWDDSHAATLDPIDRLVYRSNILGADQRITNTGGGNTSSKIMETDPLTGQPTEVLWVKGSGGDLRTSKRENFSSLYQDKLIGLQSVYASKPENGLKTPAEDEMVGMYSHTTFNLNPRHSFSSSTRIVSQPSPRSVDRKRASLEAVTKSVPSEVTERSAPSSPTLISSHDSPPSSLRKAQVPCSKSMKYGICRPV